MYQLIEIRQEHKEHIFKGLSDERVTKYYAVHFPTMESTQEQMDWYAGLKEDGKGCWWLVRDTNQNVFVGAGGFNDLDQENQKAEIGFWLYPEYWGKGILSEVMPVLFEKGFNELGLNRIEGFVDAGNAKCKKALQKINFTYEGTLREIERKGDTFLSVEVYSVLKSDVCSINEELVKVKALNE